MPEKTATVDPVKLLRDDHKKVQKLFKDFEKTEDPSEQESIFIEVSTELKIHTTVEEELFYPACREAGADEEAMNEADEEHHVVESIMMELEGMDPEAEHYSAKFMVMAENVTHHIEEEEKEMLTKFEKSKKLPEDLGELMIQRKEELVAEHAMPPKAKSRG